MLAGASGHMSNVFDIGDNDSLAAAWRIQLLYTIEEPGVCNEGRSLCNGNWHSAAFTWDGEVIILGLGAGRWRAPECEATDPPVKKSAFFYDADTGAKLGQWTLPRRSRRRRTARSTTTTRCRCATGATCSSSGNYQAGTWVADFTNPANPVTARLVRPAAARADPARWRVVDVLVQRLHLRVGDHQGPERLPLERAHGERDQLPHLNPQTQEFSIRSGHHHGHH